MKNYSVKMIDEEYAEVVSKKGKLIGNVRLLREGASDTSWACFEPGGVYINTRVAHTAEQAAFFLVEKIDQRNRS